MRLVSFKYQLISIIYPKMLKNNNNLKTKHKWDNYWHAVKYEL